MVNKKLRFNKYNYSDTYGITNYWFSLKLHFISVQQINFLAFIHTLISCSKAFSFTTFTSGYDARYDLDTTVRAFEPLAPLQAKY